jgi:hypothetical protein
MARSHHGLPGVLVCLALIASCDRIESSPPVLNPAEGSYAATDVQVVVDDNDQTVKAAVVSADFFPSMTLKPVLGRLFTDLEFQMASAPVVILSADFWTSAFARDPTAIGQRITVNGEPFTVVGIMPDGVSVPDGARLWIPRR